MPGFLLVFAAVNLVMGALVALPWLWRRPWSRRRLAVAAVPLMWAVLLVGAYLYLWAMMPPPSVVMGPEGRPIILRHGNVDWLVWEDRASRAQVVAAWLTTAMACALVVWWLARTFRARRRGAHGA